MRRHQRAQRAEAVGHVGRVLEVLVGAALPDRVALRDGIEGLHGVVLDHGVATMSPTDHNGFNTSARVMVKIENGAWKLLP